MQAWTACWSLHGRLLKPAMVVVAKAPPARSPLRQASFRAPVSSAEFETNSDSPTGAQNYGCLMAVK